MATTLSVIDIKIKKNKNLEIVQKITISFLLGQRKNVKLTWSGEMRWQRG